jgi:sugar lactone lactonase YvrE
MQIVKTRQGLSVVWGAMMSMLLGAIAAPQAHAQVPSGVFSATGASLGQTAKAFPTQDGLAYASRVSVNAKGDTFWLDVSYSQSPAATLVEVPAGSTGGNASQISLLTGIDARSGGVYVDAKQNLWVAGYGANIWYIPFVNNTYATGLVTSALTACVLPMTNVTTPCTFQKANTSAYGYYVCAWDISVDASGNIYILNRGNAVNNQILIVNGGTTSTAPTTSTVYGLFPYTTTPANMAVTSTGDIWYADRANLYYLASGSATPTIVAGFKNPSGLTLDGAGNLYVTDTGNSRIAVIPKIGNALSAASAYTLANVLSNGSVAVDAYGTVTYASGLETTGNVTSILRLPVSSRNLGSAAVGSSTAASEIDLALPAAAVFGSLTLTGGPGSPVPFSVVTNGCATGTAYTANSVCVTTVKYTATAPGPQYGSMQAFDVTGKLLASVNLVGTGLGPLIDVDPGTVSAIGTTWKSPGSIAVDVLGNTFVADSVTGGIYKNGNTTAIATGFSSPSAVVVDGAGNLYVADSGNNRIVRVPYVSGVYGTQSTIYTGTLGAVGLALDQSGNLYVADSGNKRVLLLASSAGYPLGTIVTTLGSGFTSPVAVAVDPSGNVYVADNGTKSVVEYFPTTNTKATILTGLTTAGGIAFDPGGSLFVVDSGKLTITRIPSIAGVLTPNSSTVLGQIVATPVALAIDTAGNVYAADSADSTVGKMVRTVGSLAYGPVVQNVSSQALTAVVSNAGTTGLTLSNPYFTATGSTTAFALQSSSTCANSGTVATGSTCNLSVVFTPPGVASYSETVTFASNAAASSLVLTGTGVVLVNATITGPTTLVYGYNTTTYAVTATKDGSYNLNVTGTATATIPIVVTNGVSSFTLPKLGVGTYTLALAGAVGTASLSVTPATLTLTATSTSRSFGVVNPAFTATASGAVNGDSYVLGGTSVATITSPVGTYPIVPTASGSGLSNYNVVLVNGVLTVTTAASTTGLTITSSNTFVQGGTVTFTATVGAKSPAVGFPTGTVTFQNVTVPGAPTTIGTATLTNGVATFTTTALPAGTIAVLAIYSGDTNFAGSSTATYTQITITLPSFTLQISQGQGSLTNVLPMTIIQGQTGSATLTVTPVGPFMSPVTFYCYNLPVEASCAFFNSTLTPNGGPVTATLVISTKNTATASLQKHSPFNKGEGAALLALMVGAFAGWRKKRRMLQHVCAFLLFSVAVLVPLSGCGLSETPFVTPLGVSQVTVTATSAAIATQQSVTVRLAVTSQ